MKRLLDQEGLTDELRLGVFAALVSHERPIAELLHPSCKDQRQSLRSQSEGMPFEQFSYDDHEMTLNQLAGALQEKLTYDVRVFLLSFEMGELDWGRYPLAAIVELPAPQFNLQTSANIGRPTMVALTRTSQHWTRRCPDRPATPLMKAGIEHKPPIRIMVFIDQEPSSAHEPAKPNSCDHIKFRRIPKFS